MFLLMADVIQQIRHSGFSELACQFASFIVRLDKTGDELVPLTAALVSKAVAEGHVCLNLTQLQLPSELPINLPEIGQFQSRLLASNVVGKQGEFTPLVLNENGQLYLYRYWQHEQDVADQVKRRSENKVEFDLVKLVTDFDAWQSSIKGTDWQKVAVLMALTQGLSIISGGPGTGKTTIVKTLLRFLHNQNSDLRVALAAPTGKAVARLQQSTQDSEFRFEVKTIHRLLGISADNEVGRFSAERQLSIDVLIIDEASMIDISLMAKLLLALPEKARLVLLGDSQQLASVESGAVLASLCQHSVAFSNEFVEIAQQCGMTDLAGVEQQGFLTNQLVQLRHSYRFKADSLIWQLANKVNAGDIAAVLDVLSEQPVWMQPDDNTILQTLMSGYAGFIKSVEAKREPKTILEQFDTFRLLAALKRGAQSVDAVERLIHRHLAQRGWRTQHDFYHGRPIMISQNDYRLQLFNGDIGVVLQDDDGQLKAFFCFDDKLRFVPLNRLPAHDTAFAMTVHKSQGSEFDHVAVLLPEQINPVLNKELLYTAITRAKQSVLVLSNTEVLAHTIQTQHQRQSGLDDLFFA
jgi:exodeoxyribonuclease V alpha subunit